MVEIRRGVSGEGPRERLPWLEPVEDEDDYTYGESGGYGGLILAAILVLVAIALITAGVLWYRGHKAAAGDGQIIKAEPGPYKVRPENPGGMKPDANGEVTYGTSAGQDIDSPIDLNALPEQPMVKPGGQRSGAAPVPALAQPPADRPAPVAIEPTPAPVVAAPPPAVKPAPAPIASAPAVPAVPPPAAGGDGVVQLGAFSSDMKAKAAWKALSGRFAGLRDLGLAISPVETGGKTLYRLRATGAASAARLCAQLRVAGESCSVVN